MAWSIDNQGREYTYAESVIKAQSPIAETIELMSDTDFALLMIAIERLRRSKNVD